MTDNPAIPFPLHKARKPAPRRPEKPAWACSPQPLASIDGMTPADVRRFVEDDIATATDPNVTPEDRAWAFKMVLAFGFAGYRTVKGEAAAVELAQQIATKFPARHDDGGSAA